MVVGGDVITGRGALGRAERQGSVQHPDHLTRGSWLGGRGRGSLVCVGGDGCDRNVHHRPVRRSGHQCINRIARYTFFDMVDFKNC